MIKTNKILFKVLILTIVLSALASCSTLSKNECLNADWQTIGYQDGYKGRLKSRLNKHRKSCAEYGVKPKLEEYLTGYDKGLTEYCKPVRGYRRGLLGYNNKRICKGDTRKQYNNAYRYGRHIYGLEHQVKENEESINYIVERNHRIDEKRIHAERKLINKKLNKAKRRRLVNVIRRMDHKKTHNLNAIRHHENVIDEILNEIDYLRAQGKY